MLRVIIFAVSRINPVHIQTRVVFFSLYSPNCLFSNIGASEYATGFL